MEITLSPRLSCCASFVSKGDVVADVGTDHGYIPIWLIKNSVCSRVFASDIRPGPLDNARKDAGRYGIKSEISFILCDGLSGCGEEDVNTVIIAGMGGETIIDILSAAPWTKYKKLILQPQTKQYELRAWLHDNGYVLCDARLVKDNGRLYTVWLLGPGEGLLGGAVESAMLRNRDPLLEEYCALRIEKKEKIISGLEQSENVNGLRIAKLKDEIETLKKVKAEASSWQK